MRRSAPARTASAASLLILILSSSYGHGAERAEPGHELHLEVFINDQPSNLIARFVQKPGGALATTTDELRDLRIRADTKAADPAGLVELSALPELAYRYDPARQRIDLSVPAQLQTPYVVQAGVAPEPDPPGEPVPALVANYTFVAGTSSELRSSIMPEFESYHAALSFDARAYSSLGVFAQSGLLRYGDEFEALRLNTTWSWEDPDRVLSYHAGDVVSGALPWTRPVRMSGFQVQRNFGLRPDLVTMPLPGFSGSAAVPSTIDVFLNNGRTFTGNVPAGPFQLQNLPVISGPGLHRMVIQDALGRQTVIEQPYYASAKLLRPGLTDFSAEAGFLRHGFGIESYDYGDTAIGSASARYGATDWLTLEGHAEGGGTLLNGGIGASARLWHWGVLSVSGSGSFGGDDATGGMFSAAIEAGRGLFSLYARTQRVTGNYADLASMAGMKSPLGTLLPRALRPPRAIDQVAMSARLPFDPSSISVSYAQVRDSLDADHRLLSGSWSRPLRHNASLFVTGYSDFGDSRSMGVFAGLAMSFGDQVTATASVSRSRHGVVGALDVVKVQSSEPGTWGWRVRDEEGATTSRAAAIGYRSGFGRAEASIHQLRGALDASVQMEGAVVVAQRNVFLANRIDDSFAIVDAGAPGLGVTHENRPVGRTNGSGTLLLPDLRAHQRTAIAIDAADLPVAADASVTRMQVTPRRGGTLVKFDVDQAPASALVRFRDPAGKPIEVGARVVLEPGAKEFVVGYDGEAYLAPLLPNNVVRITSPEGSECVAQFEYSAAEGTRTILDNVVCR